MDFLFSSLLLPLGRAAGLRGPAPPAPAASASPATPAHFVIIDDIVVDSQGNLFWRDPGTGARTPVSDAENAEVRRRLQHRLLACMLEVSNATFTDEDRAALGMVTPAEGGASAVSSAPASSNTDIQLHPYTAVWQRIEETFDFVEYFTPESHRAKLHFVRDKLHLLWRLSTDEGTLRNVVKVMLGMFWRKVELWRLRGAVAMKAKSMIQNLIASLTTDDVALLFTQRISFGEFVDRHLLMPSENPAPSLAPPPPPPPPPPAVPPPPPPPPLASGTNAFPKLRRAPSGSARSDSSATLAEPTIGLRAAHSTSSLPSRVPLAFSEELALRIRERSLVRTEIKSPVAQRRLARERDGQARTRQEFVLDSMKRRIIERRDSFRVSGSESEGEGGMRKKAKSAAGSEDEWEELDRRVKRKGKKEKRRASTAKSPGKELKADLKAEDGVDEVTDMFGGMEFSVRCELAKAEDVEAREGPSFMLSSLAAIGGTVSEQ